MIRLAAFVFILLTISEAVQGLEADQLLLITNANIPQGRKLAEYYAQQRHVPDRRILDLDLPKGEEMTAEEYQRNVVTVVRSFLRKNALDQKVTCLVTFYGVPIRIANRVSAPGDAKELAEIQADLKSLPEETEPLVESIEAEAVKYSPDFKPTQGKTIDAQYKRSNAALAVLAGVVSKTSDPTEHRRLEREVILLLEPLIGKMGVLQRSLGAASTRPTSQPASRPVEVYRQFHHDMLALEDRSYDPPSRQELRELVRDNLGPFEYSKILHVQEDLFPTQDTSAAFDSEISLLWWEYPKVRWIDNPLHYSKRDKGTGRALLVTRLDGPQTGIVSQMITASVMVEKKGLQGKVVIDSRGIPATDKDGKPDGYGQYDQGLRDLTELLQSKARYKLSIVFDDRPEVLEAHSVKNVAVYMGWYSVDKYVPACEFVPGAVGFHLASYTMVTLRRDDPRCWVRNLQLDGIAATLGAVEEPYLQSFPPADDFFPLLLTGKLTLAEVYWLSIPWSSWRISMIGDPLYIPYKMNPALAVDDLPMRLRRIFQSPPATAATAPSH